MASGFIMELAKKKPAPGRGGDSAAADDGKESDDLEEEPKDDYSDVTQSALDDIAEILGVQEKDRSRFDSALEDLCEACAKRAVSEEG